MYLPIAGNAAHFIVAGYTPPVAPNVGFLFSGALYSGPGGTAVQAQFPPGYSAPGGFVAHFVVVAATEYIGIGEVSVQITAVGDGEFRERSFVGDGQVSVEVSVSGAAVVGFSGVGVVVGDSPTVDGYGVRGESGYGIVLLGQFDAAGVGVVKRYEIQGEVRQNKVLVNRRVRVYDRNTGDLVIQGDTVAGRFRLHTGFEEAECYVIPIDLSGNAVDWSPPCSNRLMSVLAEDA